MNNSRIVLLLSFSFCRPIIFSSICYSHLNYRLAPRVGHSVSEPGLLRPGKTRRSQTNKKPKSRRRASPQSGSCQGDIKGTPATQSPKRLPFLFLPPCFSPSISPHPSSDTSYRWLNHRQMLPKCLFFFLLHLSFSPFRVSVFGASPHGLGSI